MPIYIISKALDLIRSYLLCMPVLPLVPKYFKYYFQYVNGIGNSGLSSTNTL